MNVPCNECKKRYLGCHAECEDYAEFKAKMAEINEKRRAEKEAYCEFKSYKKDRFKD